MRSLVHRILRLAFVAAALVGAAACGAESEADVAADDESATVTPALQESGPEQAIQTAPDSGPDLGPRDLTQVAAETFGVDAAELRVGTVSALAGTDCDIHIIGVDGAPAAEQRRFVVMPNGGVIVGSESAAVGTTFTECFEEDGIEPTVEQLVSLVLDMGESQRLLEEVSATGTGALAEAGLDYEAPSLTRTDDELTLTFLALDQDFGDILHVAAKRVSQGDFVVNYEVLHTAS